RRDLGVDRRVALARDERAAAAEVLVDDLLVGRDRGSAREDREREVRRPLEREGNDPAALAPAMEAHPRAIDLGLGLQEAGRGYGVVRIDGQIGAGRELPRVGTAR